MDSLKVIELARRMGIDVSDSTAVRLFLASFDFVEAKLSSGKSDTALAKEFGISIASIRSARVVGTDGRIRSYEEIASSIILDDFFANETRENVRATMFKVYSDHLPFALENMGLIASGRPGRNSNQVPRYEDQISAFKVFAETPVAQAWLEAMMTGNQAVKVENKPVFEGPVLDLDSLPVHNNAVV